MKIFANIPGFAKLLNSLRYMNVNKKVIEDARAAGDFEREREYILKSTSVWGDMVFKMFGSELTVYGEENIPDHGRVVFIGNHQGYADIPTYFVALKKFQFGFVAKEELWQAAVFRQMDRQDPKRVHRQRDDPPASLNAIKKGIEYINDGFSLVIFPEGTRSRGHVILGRSVKGST